VISCPCGHAASYDACCQPLHLGKTVASNPEQLMRSRYCAFVMSNAEYIFLSHSPQTREQVSVAAINDWNNQCDWRGLQVITSKQDHKLNRVEFIAWYKQDGKLQYHHELSLFMQEPLDSGFSQLIQPPVEHVWYYHSASYPNRNITVPKRNDPCICHSGKKLKKCCG